MNKPRSDWSLWQSRRAAAGVAILFLVLGGLWFFFFDAVLLLLPVSPDAITHHQALKGATYVVVTALLAYCYLAKTLGGQRQVLEALCRSERKYRELVEHANSIILHWTRDGRITFLNEFGQRFFGYTEAEILGQHVVGTIVPATDSTGGDLHTLMDQICADPVAFKENVNENIRRNGEKVWIAWTNKVYFDDQGQVEGILSIGTDISERKRMEEALRTSEERLRLFFERQNVGLAITSPEKGWLQVNDRLCEMLGYPRKELVCRTWVELTHPDDLEQDVVQFNRLLAGDIDGYSLDKRFLRKDGTIVWTSLSIGCVRRQNGSVDYVLALLVDITERKKAEEEAKLSATLIHYLSKYANDFIILLDENFCFLEVNERVVDFYGYTREELIGMHASQLRAPETNEEFIKQMKVVQVSDKALYATMHQRKDGTKFPVEISLHAIENEGRKFYQAIIRDITERARVEQALHDSELKHRTLYETADDAILLMRGDRFIDCNARALAMFGCSREQIIGAHPVEFSPPTQPDGRRSDESAIEKINQALKGKPQLFEWEHYRWDKTPFTAEVNLNSLELGGEVLLQTIVRDISERKRAEENLRRLNAELEQRVIKRTADLAAAKERAESADRLKSAFLAAMSHELRTPLNSIIGFTGIVLQGLPGPLNAEQTKQLGMVQGSARHLLDLINDILDLSKIEAGQLEVEARPFDVRESVEKVMRLVAPLAEKKKLTLTGDVSPNVGELTSDRRRFEQILINLLNNALKFSEQGQVRVECAVNSRDLVTRVLDTGIGIRPEDRGKLFHTFQQIETGLSRTHEGSGLGLSICKKLVEMMGGKISVESEWGVGSTFTFTVPFGQE